MVAPGPLTKEATTTSSSDKVKASSQPATKAGARAWYGDQQKGLDRSGTEIAGGSFKVGIEADEFGLHDHQDEGCTEGGMRKRNRQQAAFDAERDEQH